MKRECSGSLLGLSCDEMWTDFQGFMVFHSATGHSSSLSRSWLLSGRRSRSPADRFRPFSSFCLPHLPIQPIPLYLPFCHGPPHLPIQLSPPRLPIQPGPPHLAIQPCPHTCLFIPVYFTCLYGLYFACLIRPAHFNRSFQLSCLAPCLDPSPLLVAVALAGLLLAQPGSVHLCIHGGLTHLFVHPNLSPLRRMVTPSHSERRFPSSRHCFPGHSSLQHTSPHHRIPWPFSHFDSRRSSLWFVPADWDCLHIPICKSLSHYHFLTYRVDRLSHLIGHGGIDESRTFRGGVYWLGLCDLQFRLVIRVPPTHHLAERMFLWNIRRKSTHLSIV